MTTRPTFGLGGRALLAAAGTVVVIAGMRAASTILVPLLVALFVSVVSWPLLAWLVKRRVPRALAVLLTILADVAVLALVGLLVTGSINELVRERGKYERRVLEIQSTIQEWTENAALWLEEHGVPTEDWLPEPPAPAEGSSPVVVVEEDAVAAAAGTSWWANLFDLGALLDAANRAVLGLATALSTALVVVLIVTFVLLEASGFRQKLAVAWGDPRVEGRIASVALELRRYLSLKTLVSAATGLLVAGWVGILGVDFALLWGLVAFALNFIPNLGSILAAIPAVLLALLQQGIGLALLVGFGYLVINVIIGNFLEPQLMGRRLGLSPLVVFLSLVFWGWVWGPVGMLLSVPLTMVLKILLENSEDFQHIAVLLEGPAQIERRIEAAREG